MLYRLEKALVKTELNGDKHNVGNTVQAHADVELANPRKSFLPLQGTQRLLPNLDKCVNQVAVSIPIVTGLHPRFDQVVGVVKPQRDSLTQSRC